MKVAGLDILRPPGWGIEPVEEASAPTRQRCRAACCTTGSLEQLTPLAVMSGSCCGFTRYHIGNLYIDNQGGIG